MDPVSPHTPDATWLGYTAQVMWLLLAMAGGVARYLDSYLRTGIMPNISALFAHAMVSGFSGYMVAQVILRIEPDWALVAAGIGGYLGTQGLDWAAHVVKNRALPGSSASKGE